MIQTIEKNGKEAKKLEKKPRKKVNILDTLNNARDSANVPDSSSAYRSPMKRSMKQSVLSSPKKPLATKKSTAAVNKSTSGSYVIG